MRIAHIIKVTRISGAEGHLLALLAGLRLRGLDARLLMLVEPGQPMDDMLEAASARGIPITRLTIRRDYDLPLLFRLRAALREMQPNIVHTHLIHGDIYGYFAARAAGLRPVVSSRHNDDQFRHRPRWRRIHRWLWGRIDAGIAISAAIRRFTIEVEGAPADKVSCCTLRLGFWLAERC